MGSPWIVFGALILIIWGAAHVAPVLQVVRGFGDIGRDNRIMILMEWVAEGLATMFLGFLPFLLTVTGHMPEPGARLAVRACGGMCLAMAAWHLATGARTRVLPMKICPAVLTASGIMLLAGA